MTQMKTRRPAAELAERGASRAVARKFPDAAMRMHARGQLSDVSLAAARDLVRTVELLMGGGKAPPELPMSGPARRDGGTVRRILARDRFNDWVDRLDAAGLNAGVALDILVDGDGFGTVERRYRRRHGWARDQLVRALGLWPVTTRA